MIRYLWAAFLLLVSGTAAFAQGSAMHLQCLTGSAPPWDNCSTDHPLPITGSFSVGGFTPTTTGTPISVTTGGVTGTLPVGTVVTVSNVGGTNSAYCKLGASATTSDQLIAPNSWFAFTVGAATQLTCITSTSTTTVNMVGGSGLPTGAGGGGGSAAALTNYALETGGNLASILAAVSAAIPAGTAIIGKVGIDQTTPGTTNLVSLATGTNTVGSVKQTDGTTVVVTDPCQGSTKSFLPITATTALVKVIATGVSAKKIYICQLVLTTTAANNVAVFEATTATTCATNPVAVYGAGTTVATAANGFPFPANGGVSLGSGGYFVGQTATAANDLCIGTSAATPLTGGITYVTQ